MKSGKISSIDVDARGLKCPLPVLRLRKIALTLPVGSIIDMRADDPAAESDVPAFAAEMGWSAVSTGVLTWRIVTA